MAELKDKALVSAETQLPSLPEALRAKINEATPRSAVKTRPGRGNQPVAYVELSWVTGRLNEIFGHLWDFEIISEQVGNDQVWVKGQLKVWLSPTFCITKNAFGGADIAKRPDGKPVDIGDTLKSASADALKKASSLLGIAADVYSGDNNGQPIKTIGQSEPEPF